jgi:hypothetical protein
VWALTACRAQTEAQVRTSRGSGRARGHLRTAKRRQREMSGHQEKTRVRGALTPCRAQTKGHVRARRESERARCTHSLSSADGGTCQGTKRKREGGEGDSLPVERTRRDRSGHQDRARERGELTPCWAHTEGQVRAPRESERAGGTHCLSSADGGTSQDTKRK